VACRRGGNAAFSVVSCSAWLQPVATVLPQTQSTCDPRNRARDCVRTHGNACATHAPLLNTVMRVAFLRWLTSSDAAALISAACSFPSTWKRTAVWRRARTWLGGGTRGLAWGAAAPGVPRRQRACLGASMTAACVWLCVVCVVWGLVCLLVGDAPGGRRQASHTHVTHAHST
jgi:hypothetical protein